MAGQDIKRLFLAYRRELQAYLTRKLRDAEVAADLTQDTFLRIAEQGAAGMVHERAYLYRTAHNLMVDHIRLQQREKTDPSFDEAVVEIVDERPSPERAATAQNELDRVREALLELPERTREIFALVRIEGLTYRQVANRLEISDSSVQKHLAKAIKHVTQRLRTQ